HGTFFFQAEVGIRGRNVTGVQTCALPISGRRSRRTRGGGPRELTGDRRTPGWGPASPHPATRKSVPPEQPRNDMEKISMTTSGQIGRASCREHVAIEGERSVIQRTGTVEV